MPGLGDAAVGGQSLAAGRSAPSAALVGAAGAGVALVMLGLLGPSAAVSAPLDGTTPFLCAVVQALECAPDGTCERRGWSAVIVSDTGKMSVSIVDEAATFVGFGACTAP